MATDIRCGRHTIRFGRAPRIVGILNVTPDSFSDGGRFVDTDAAVAHAHRMVREGADAIDVGGESTRPGAETVGPNEELDRVMPVCEALLGGTDAFDPIDVPVSIDTRKAIVASAAVAAGAGMVNDVSACADADMPDVLRRAGDNVAVVLMHMKGSPRTMQQAPSYIDPVAEVTGFLDERAAWLISEGIAASRIVIDPGIGFGKRLSDNLLLLKNIDALRRLGYPVLIGASRKSFIGRLLDAAPDDRLNGSLAVAAQCYNAGVEMVRVHDVAETKEVLRVLDAMAEPDDYADNE